MILKQIRLNDFCMIQQIKIASAIIASEQLLEINQENLWIGTRYGGLNCYNLKSRQFENRISDPKYQSILSDAIIRNLYSDKNNNLWISTNKGLYIYNLTSGEFTEFLYGENIPDRLSSKSIRHVYKDRNNLFWISTINGLNRYNPETKAITQYLPENNNINSIKTNNIRLVYEDTSNRMWVAAHMNGLMIFDRTKQTFSIYDNDKLNPNSLSSNSIRVILEDKGGIIWIGTLGGGISIFDPGTDRFKQYRSKPDNVNSLSHSIIWSIMQSRDGDIWFATHRGGLTRFGSNTGLYTHFKNNPADRYSISSNNLRSVMEDRKGNIWISSQNAGINRFDRDTQKFFKFTHDAKKPGSLNSNNVRAIYEDHSGNLWICTWNGLDLYDPQSNSFTHFINQPDNPNSLSGNSIISIYQDSDENFWVATTNGLNKITFSSGTQTESILNLSEPDFTHFFYNSDDPNSLSNNYVLSIYEAKNGDLWFGTMLGLNRLEKQHRNQPIFTRYLMKNGLPNDIIYGILEDSAGHIWCSTNNGLSHINLQNGIIKNYDMRDGLHSNEFNTGAYVKTAEGSMIFGGVDGATEFYPDSLYDNPYLAPVVLTGFHIFDQPAGMSNTINSTKEISLSYKDNYFSFDFASLDFSKPERNQYAYMLEGFDRDWINSGTRRFAGYTNVDPGEYLFRVKGTNGDGVWNETGPSVKIIITPPFWKTWWFIILFSLAVIGSVAFIIINRVRQLLAIERLRSKIAADLHDDIGAGLTEISIMGEVIAQKLPDQSKENVNTELDKIGNTARNLIDSMSHIVWMVNPRRDSLYDLISRLGNTYTDLLETKEIQFKVENLESLKKVHLKMEHRQHLFHIFHEAINNSIKYSNATEIILSSNLLGKKLRLKLTDNGRGFDIEKITNGNGLENMKDRARQIGGTLSIISSLESGTEIKFEGRIS